jgi:Type II secretion system (T2SS), protein E, N-terminal domain
MYPSGSVSKGLPKASPTRTMDKVRSLWQGWLPQCSNPACTQKALARVMARQNTGISVAEKWICGPDCFEEVARERLSAIMSSRHSQEAPPKLRMPLGLFLVSRGDLTGEQLKLVLEEQKKSGANIGEIIQQLGFASQEQVTAAVAAQWSCAVFPLRDRLLEPPVHIPRRLLETYGMLPVHFADVGRKLMVGFVTRVQYHILHTIEHITSCVATPCFITAREYDQYLHSAAFGERDNEVVFDRVSGTAEMAKLARNYIHQIGAHQARFGICRDYLWMRIWGNRNEMDLLFRLQPD